MSDGALEELQDAHRAIDFALLVLLQLEKKGSVTKEYREEAIRRLWEARQTRFPQFQHPEQPGSPLRKDSGPSTQ